MYKLNIVFQTIKPIQKLSLKLKSLKKINQFKNIEIKSIFKTHSKKKLFTVLKSPHVNKKAREQFIFKTYNQNVIFTLKKINQLLSLIIFLKKKFTKDTKIQFKIKLNKNKIKLNKNKIKLNKNKIKLNKNKIKLNKKCS